MKIRYILFSLLLLAGMVKAQEYPLVTIQQIQEVPDSLKGTDPKSPLMGDTVRIQGVVMVAPVVDAETDRRTIISAGGRWSIYVQDPAGNVWGGMNVLQHDTTGAAQSTFLDAVDTAQVWEFTGVVNEYLTSTQFELLINPPVAVEYKSELTKRPDPIVLTLSDLFVDGAYNFDAEKYEGMYVEFRNVISSDRVAGTGGSGGNFKINDGKGNFAFIYNQSRYFKTSSAALGDYQPPLDGSNLSFVRGIVTTRTDGYYIVPLYPGDVGPVTVSPPIVSNVRRTTALVAPNQGINITASVRDLDGAVASAQLYYRVNGGDRLSVNMTRSAGDSLVYEATIPGVDRDSALVDFYIKASDNMGNVGHNPSDTTTGNYLVQVLNRPLTIKDIQYSPYGSGFSAYNNYRVQISGVITADTSDIPGYSSTPLRIYVQDGEGAWSGMQVGTLGSLGTQTLNLRKGDNVTLEGVIMEGFNVTKIDSLSILTVNSSGNPLPAASVITTGEMGTGGAANVNREKWESVLVKYVNVTIDSTNADGTSNFGEILVNDGTGVTRVELQDGNHSYHNTWDGSGSEGAIEVHKGDRFTELQGVMYYSFSNYKLVPRVNSDFIGYQPVVGVEDEVSPAKAYNLEQNYPNPFNPATTIRYSIPKEGFVTLKIYNILGQEMMTLVSKFQSAGTYNLSFDASSLTSGMYLYSIESEGFKQVKKMMLVK